MYDAMRAEIGELMHTTHLSIQNLIEKANKKYDFDYEQSLMLVTDAQGNLSTNLDPNDSVYIKAKMDNITEAIYDSILPKEERFFHQPFLFRVEADLFRKINFYNALNKISHLTDEAMTIENLNRIQNEYIENNNGLYKTNAVSAYRFSEAKKLGEIIQALREQIEQLNHGMQIDRPSSPR